MATLAGTTIKDTYPLILKIDSTGVDTTLRYIEDGDATDSTLKIATNAIAIDAGDKLYLDGDEGTPHTYLHQVSADKLDIVVGGQTILEVTEGGGGASDSVSIQALNKLYLDGGSDTYLHEVSADKLDIVVGSQTILEIAEGGGGASDSVSIQALNKLYLDGGSDTYLHEVSADKLDIVVGGQTILEIAEGGGGASDSVSIQALNKLYLDGGTHTYIQESADGVVDFYADNVQMLQLLEGGTDYVWLPVDSEVLALGAGKDLQIYHNGSHSFIANSTGTLNLATLSNGIAVSIGHTTSETTVNDNLTVTGTLAMGSISGNIIMADDTSIGISDSDERIEFDGAGDISLLGCNVGIGIDSPGAILHIAKAATTGSAPIECLRLEVSESFGDVNTTTGEGPSIDFYVAETGGSEYAGRIAVVRESGTDATADAAMTFYISEDDATPSEKMRIGSDGKVGIGTGSNDPTELLEIEVATGGVTGLIHSNSLANGENSEWRVQGKKSGGSVRDAVLGVIFDDDLAQATAFISLEESGGTASYFWCDASDDFRISTTKTDIGGTGGTVVGAQTSDERLKNISSDEFPYGLAEINNLKPIKYNYKSASSVDKLGFGAQTIKPIIPETVYDTGECIDGYDWERDEDGKKIKQFAKSDDPDTKLSMEYVQIIPVLVKAVQELSAKVTALENA